MSNYLCEALRFTGVAWHGKCKDVLDLLVQFQTQGMDRFVTRSEKNPASILSSLRRHFPVLVHGCTCELASVPTRQSTMSVLRACNSVLAL